MRTLIVLVNDKSGERMERVRLKNTQASVIGRAWHSDVIVQDKFVEADHLSIQLSDEGLLHVCDLDSTNGSTIAGKPVEGSAVYRFGDVIRIGDTNLQIYDAADGVAPAAVRSSWFLLIDRFKGVPAVLGLTLVALALHLASSWLFASEPVLANDVVTIVITALVVLVAWTLLMSFGSKLLRGEGNMRAFWVLGCLILGLLEIATLLLAILRFNLQRVDVGSLLSTVTYSAIAILLLVGALTFATHMQRRSKWVFSTLLVLTIVGLFRSDEWLKPEHEKWTAQTQTESVTLPPAFLWRAPVSLSQFESDAERVFDFELAQD
ncbi:hypothetical protein GCM10008090_15050 [Arenicella chitinivorans]|uniref:FHA domain-containing protein n=1 Tax=Arenicella chitinivorans TaxID=1329800 RepID=A0A918RPQ6_9GAMM|nr:FHA domain-containing protein [Arenicella chitinivorans]GHA06359.1 hypothetical protein GCM10008090_15050 [Arenicella chitinivorans]